MMELLESVWDPRVGQRWHCKSTKSTIIGEVVEVCGKNVYLKVDSLGDRWVDVDLLRQNFFPLIVGSMTVL